MASRSADRTSIQRLAVSTRWTPKPSPRVAPGLLQAVASPCKCGDDHVVGVTGSIGVALYPEAGTELADIVGPICESADILGHDRLLPPTQEGDVLLIANAGAYGHAMGSSYNLREPATEICL